MRFMALVTASPLFAFEMNVPCHASPASMSSVRCGARARNAATCPASCAMPPARNDEPAFALCTMSASRCPWMSSVCRSWIRSSPNAADVGAGVTAGEHAQASESASAAAMRSTSAMLTSTDAAFAAGGGADLVQLTDERRRDAFARAERAALNRGRDQSAESDGEIVADRRADRRAQVRRITAASCRRRCAGHRLLRGRGLRREPRDRGVRTAWQPRGRAAHQRRNAHRREDRQRHRRGSEARRRPRQRVPARPRGTPRRRCQRAAAMGELLPRHTADELPRDAPRRWRGPPGHVRRPRGEAGVDLRCAALRRRLRSFHLHGVSVPGARAVAGTRPIPSLGTRPALASASTRKGGHSTMDLTAILTWIIFGAIVGVIARFLMPGRDSMGWIATIVLGIVGSFVGGWLAQLLFQRSAAPPPPSARWIGSIIGALLCLAVYPYPQRR